jgi:hypothetical protein
MHSKFPVFYATWRHISFSKQPSTCSSPQLHQSHAFPSNFLKSVFNVILSCIFWSSKLFLSFSFAHQTLICIYHYPSMCHISSESRKDTFYSALLSKPMRSGIEFNRLLQVSNMWIDCFEMKLIMLHLSLLGCWPCIMCRSAMWAHQVLACRTTLSSL